MPVTEEQWKIVLTIGSIAGATIALAGSILYLIDLLDIFPEEQF